jgi:hypothetical protein
MAPSLVARAGGPLASAKINRLMGGLFVFWRKRRDSNSPIRKHKILDLPTLPPTFLALHIYHWEPQRAEKEMSWQQILLLHQTKRILIEQLVIVLNR